MTDRDASSSSWSFLGLDSTSGRIAPQAVGMDEQQTPSEDPSGAHPPSIFGSIPPPSSSQPPERTHERPPLFSITEPSQDDIPSIQRPLAALAPSPIRASHHEDDIRATADRRRIPQVEKYTEDSTDPQASGRNAVNHSDSSTQATLSRLFAVKAPVSPDNSRNSSYENRTSRSAASYTRNLQTGDAMALPDHLYNRGLLEGRHSDITVNAFGHKYRLHRLILDRAPFFTSALSEPWMEANAASISIQPDDVDCSITQASFELALKRLYGCSDFNEEDGCAVGLFATGCWLEMNDLVESSISSILRQMKAESIGSLIRLVTNNYYGKYGDKILASAKAMLCRDGWHMSLRHWDKIPGDVIREIVGGDGFFVESEWDRWVLAKRILDRRLVSKAVEAGLVEQGRRKRPRQAPASASLMAVRFDGVYRKNSMSSAKGSPASLDPWIAIYTHPEVEPLLVLLDEGVHYVHLAFEQLQRIRRAKDGLGLPILPEAVVSNALWQQMELRQKITNARESDVELGLSEKCTDDYAEEDTRRQTTMSGSASSGPRKIKGKQRVSDVAADEEEGELDSGSWDGNGKPRKFWIPSQDCNIVMGGSADPIVATSPGSGSQRHASRPSSTIQPEDVQWASDFSSSQPRPWTASPDSAATNQQPEIRYTHFPPFRFAAEFPNPKKLGKKRVYSRTVFYAGSLWNIYVQKIVSTRSRQLGVYLHRAKEQDTEDAFAGVGRLPQESVDELIGRLERDMLMRNEARFIDHTSTDDEDYDSSESVGGHGYLTSSTASRPRYLASTGRKSAGRIDGLAVPTNASGENLNITANNDDSSMSASSAHDDEDNDMYNRRGGQAPRGSRARTSEDYQDATSSSDHAGPPLHRTSTLPPYVDTRPMIKTYFKIYSPSRAGRMLSVYESAPDQFKFAQSWGWKSSTLMLDEGLWAADEGDEELGTVGREDGGTRGVDGRSVIGGSKTVTGDGKLRFMVVIGNI